MPEPRIVPDEVTHLEGTLRSVITILPLIAFGVGVVSYSFNLQSQINVLQVRQEAAISSTRESVIGLKEDIRDLTDIVRQVAPRQITPRDSK